MTSLVDDMEALRRHWQHDRWVVGGQSWGAHLALFYALAHPERTLGLILLNSTGVRWGWSAQRRANRLPRLTHEERAEVDELEARLALGEDDSARSRLRDLMWLADFADRANAVRTPRFSAHPISADVVESIERDWMRALGGIQHQVARLMAPALVLHGEADPIAASGPRELAGMLPRGRFVVLPGVGHVPWLERGEDLRVQLRDFLTDAELRRARGRPSPSHQSDGGPA